MLQDETQKVEGEYNSTLFHKKIKTQSQQSQLTAISSGGRPVSTWGCIDYVSPKDGKLQLSSDGESGYRWQFQGSRNPFWTVRPLPVWQSVTGRKYK